jgi:hypothetical protein
MWRKSSLFERQADSRDGGLNFGLQVIECATWPDTGPKNACGFGLAEMADTRQCEFKWWRVQSAKRSIQIVCDPVFYIADEPQG